jgi:RNA polymerase sigma-70 factor (ECF subfamily)
MIDPPADTNEQLARRAQGGCANSFEELVRRFQVPLLQFLRKKIKSPDDAEDILQETFVRAYQQLARYHDRWRFSTWVFTIAHHCAISHHRKQKAELHRIAVVREARGDVWSLPDRSMEDEESRRRFWALASGLLTQDQFTAVWLYYVEGMPARQIMRVLDCSWVSVKTTLYRARRRLEPHVAPWRNSSMPFPKSGVLVPVRSAS